MYSRNMCTRLGSLTTLTRPKLSRCICIFMLIVYVYAHMYMYVNMFICTKDVDAFGDFKDLTRTNLPRCKYICIFVLYICIGIYRERKIVTTSTGSNLRRCMFVCVCIYMFMYTCICIHTCIYGSMTSTCSKLKRYVYLYVYIFTRCAMATVSRIDKIICLFCRIAFLLQGSCAKVTYNFIDPTNRSHPIYVLIRIYMYLDSLEAKTIYVNDICKRYM